MIYGLFSLTPERRSEKDRKLHTQTGAINTDLPTQINLYQRIGSMKLEVKKDEAFIKLSIDDNNNVQFAYGFNMDPPIDLEGKVSDDRFAAIMTVISLVAGLTISVKKYPDQVLEIGDAALESGDFDIDMLMHEDTQDMLENLSEDQLELLFTPTEGVQ